MLEIRNHQQVASQIDHWLARIEREATQTAKGLASEVLERFINFSPQFSGDFAASWNISVNQIDYSFEGYPGEAPFGQPFHVGSPGPIQVAKRHSQGKLANFRLGDTIYISNSAVHDDAYALLIWNDRIRLRPENLTPTIRDAQNYLVTYSGVLSPQKARMLRNKKV